MAENGFHPAVAAWFDSRFSAPTPPQVEAWPSIRAGRDTLIAAPTGSGKTLAAFLAAIDDLVRRGERGELGDETRVVYVSPLKALSNDIQQNLQAPLSGISAELAIRGLPDIEIRTMVRTGDTSTRDREAMVRRPPHIVVTTPESLFILLTSERGRRMLQTVRTVIVDEIHAMVGSKRGSHLSLTVERLQHLVKKPLVRVGLSATQKPIDEVARFLVGSGGRTDCTIVDTGHVRELDLALEVPSSPLEAVMSGEVWEEIYERVANLIQEHRTTLVFVNTRRMAERVARYLTDRLGEAEVTSHHGSLSKEQRLDAEQRLKDGRLKALVATASLELGIDIGDVDLVCQIGSTRSIATFLQRVGRSGHAVSALPKGRLFPLSRDELVECAALFDAVRRGELDRLFIPDAPLDILAQQIVAAVACHEWKEDELYAMVRRAYPYRNLSPKDFDAVVHMLANGFSTRRGRRSAYLHRDGVNRRLRPRRGARLSAITSGGAIPDTADYRVILEPSDTMIGTVNEDFAVESMAGDIFQLGNASWCILRIEPGVVRVQDAGGQPPTIPFWLGEAPGRTTELSQAVSRLREEVGERIDLTGIDRGDDENAGWSSPALDPARDWLTDEVGVPDAAAEQIVEYLGAAKAALGVVPTQKVLVLERFFDESGGMQLVIHSPFGSRLNRAWGLALRKRFCRKFNFELQAAATEDAIVLSLGPTHSFPLGDVYRYLHTATVRDILVQALLDAPMFAVRWRWNAGRALAVPRFQGGRKVPPQLQRIQAEDLISVVFPDSLACFENIQGDREIPDHPLVQETIRDCLHEAMDIEHLEQLLTDIENGVLALEARDLREPSPLAAEILNAKPYAFLDDAPLEERRTQAVMSRRWLDPQTASDLGALDVEAILRVRGEAWPEAVSPDELHDALMLLGFLTEREGNAGHEWPTYFDHLVRERRATRFRPRESEFTFWVAAERLPHLQAVFPDAQLAPPLTAPDPVSVSRDEALVELVRSRLEGVGPTTAASLASSMSLPARTVELPLVALETEGFAIRGKFTPEADDTEWCDRRLLARIHRYTLNRLRREIEPVSPTQFMRFLLRWQGALSENRGEGPGALERALRQLEGFEASAVAWESDVLPLRVSDYDPAWLDSLCLSGRVAWARVSPPRPKNGRSSRPVRTTPIAFVDRGKLSTWLALSRTQPTDGITLSTPAAAVLEFLARKGASFFTEIAQGTELLATQTEQALGELVAAGTITADGFAGLRALLIPSNRRGRGNGNRRRSRVGFAVEDGGRWTVLPGRNAGAEVPPEYPSVEEVEDVARILLLRYGVVFRRLLEREGALPPWRDLVRVYHRLEARGEIRGGRFVAGFSGEQFALPDAVGTLREVRRDPGAEEMVSVGGADPLNLVGIVTPGPRVPGLPGNRVLYRGGEPVAVRVSGETQVLVHLDAADEWSARKALDRRPYPQRLRAYLGALG